jgi:hypothetical protein
VVTQDAEDVPDVAEATIFPSINQGDFQTSILQDIG